MSFVEIILKNIPRDDDELALALVQVWEALHKPTHAMNGLDVKSLCANSAADLAKARKP